MSRAAPGETGPPRCARTRQRAPGPVRAGAGDPLVRALIVCLRQAHAHREAQRPLD